MTSALPLTLPKFPQAAKPRCIDSWQHHEVVYLVYLAILNAHLDQTRKIHKSSQIYIQNYENRWHCSNPCLFPRLTNKIGMSWQVLSTWRWCTVQWTWTSAKHLPMPQGQLFRSPQRYDWLISQPSFSDLESEDHALGIIAATLCQVAQSSESRRAPAVQQSAKPKWRGKGRRCQPRWMLPAEATQRFWKRKRFNAALICWFLLIAESRI